MYIHPQQFMPAKEIKFPQQEQEINDKEIDKLLIKGVISETTHCPSEYIWTIFICSGKILKLKNLNEHMEHQHF